MIADLEKFKAMFPQWANCPDETLTLWAEIAGCVLCVPQSCKGLKDLLPCLMLAHMLTVNGIECPAETTDGDAEATDCSCDDEYLTAILNKGTKISSVSIEGISVGFDNNSSSNAANVIAGKGAFSAWLSTTNYGTQIAALIKRQSRGPFMAVGAHCPPGHYAEPISVHPRLAGHG